MQLNCLFFESYHFKDHLRIQKARKIYSNRSNSGSSFKFTNRDRRALKRIVGRRHRTTAAKVTAHFNQHLDSPVSTKTVRRDKNCFPLSTFRSDWRGLRLMGLQTHGSKWYSPMSHFFYFLTASLEAAQGSLLPSAFFPHWSTEFD